MSLKTQILFRKGLEEEGEFDAASKYFDVVEYRSTISPNSLIIGRYSVLPYYSELEKEIKLKNSRLINSYDQHLYVADIQNWYSDLQDITPETWFTWGHLPEGQYVVKGRTNSRKHEWNKRMFAKNKEQLVSIAKSLLDDALISEQGLCVRKYIPLKTFDKGINDLPITNEWRFFFYKDKIIDFGYYWSFYENKPRTIDKAGILKAKEAAKIVADKINFFVVDVAETESGEWIVIELNDAQMSGLSCINPDSLYANMAQEILK